MNINFNNKRFLRLALLIFAAHTIFFLIQLPQVYLYGSQSPQSGGVWIVIARLAWGTYVSAFITPFVLWLGYRLPITRQHLWRNLLLHLLFSIAAGAVQHFGYASGLLALNLSTAEAFRAGLFNLAVLLNFISTSILRNAAILGIQQAYLYFRESQERAFRLQQAELEMLKAQLQPHFLFNALNAISALIHKSPKDADQTITQLSDLLRISLSNGKTQEVTLKVELEFLQAYLQIQQTLMKQRLEVSWNIDPKTLDALIPNMILQPIAENSIKHGLAPLEEGGRLEISAVCCNGTLHLEMSDNGKGIGEKEPFEGIGLSNTRVRLKHLYGEDHQLKFIAPPNGGLNVKIEIPFREWNGEIGN
ncbi:MAG: histidine kinase [Acidobacteriota bacterium]|nr:histidine kinase [Acidobacteriota bacterium]